MVVVVVVVANRMESYCNLRQVDQHSLAAMDNYYGTNPFIHSSTFPTRQPGDYGSEIRKKNRRGQEGARNLAGVFPPLSAVFGAEKHRGQSGMRKRNPPRQALLHTT